MNQRYENNLNELKKENFQINFLQDDYVFLIGNGINFSMQSKNSGWNKILYNLFLDHTLRDQLFTKHSPRHPRLSSVETLNILQINDQRKNDREQINFRLASTVNGLKFSKQSSPMLDFLSKTNATILTTNFDLNMEQYFWGNDYTAEDGDTPGAHYHWARYYHQTGLKSGLRIAHIHGSKDLPMTMMFSTTRYMRAATRATVLLNSKSRDLARSVMSSAIEKTWLWPFFSRPLMIAGLGLGDSETFLRWLLLERAMNSHKYGCEETLPSFYLYRKQDKMDKLKLFLKAVRIIPVCVGEDVFRSSIWQQQNNNFRLEEN